MREFLITLAAILMPVSVQAGGSGDVKLNAKTHTFPNGLQLVVVERHWSPTASFIVRFKVGSADEHPGITGSAHLLEHMLFKGTKTIGTSNYDAEVPLMAQIDSLAHRLTDAIVNSRNPLYRGDRSEIDSLKAAIAKIQEKEKQYVIKDEFWETMLENGGSSLNASTGNDGTQYFVSLPSNRLELWAYLESNRMANPILREFYSERDVVYEERRLRTDNDPGGKLWEQLYAAAYTAHPYGWPVLGWPSDLETVFREDVDKFFHQYYAPNNVVVAVVGDVNFDDVVRTVGKYFNEIPPSKIAPPPVTTVEPEQTGERRVAVEYDAKPQLAIGWICPAGGGVDKEVYDVIANLLSRGRTSRFYKSIVEQKQLATSVYASSDFTRFPDLFTISATPRAPHTVAEVEQAIYDEIDRLKNEGPSDWELQRVRNQLQADYIRGMQSNMGMAFRISDMQALVGDWSHINRVKENRQAVSAADIKRVLAQEFIPDRRTVAFIVKTEQQQAAEKSAKTEPRLSHEGNAQ